MHERKEALSGADQVVARKSTERICQSAFPDCINHCLC